MKKLSLILLIVLAATSTNAQKVKVGADPAANLAKYKTYTWDKPLPPGNPLVQQTIIDAVDQAMTAKGLTKVESQADITIAYFAAVDTDIQIAYPLRVWRGSANHTLEHGPTGNPAKDAKSVEKPIRKAVEKMFKQFPRPS